MKKVEEGTAKANNTFINAFIKEAEGDDIVTFAIKVWKGAESSITSHISAFKFDAIELEDKVETAREIFESSKVNFGGQLLSREAYVEALIESKNNLAQAEVDLANHLSTVAFLEDVLEELSL